MTLQKIKSNTMGYLGVRSPLSSFPLSKSYNFLPNDMKPYPFLLVPDFPFFDSLVISDSFPPFEMVASTPIPDGTIEVYVLNLLLEYVYEILLGGVQDSPHL